MRCVRTYSDGRGTVLRREHACALGNSDCIAAGGRPENVHGSCSEWCSEEAAASPWPNTSADGRELLSCALPSCVKTFTEDSPAVQAASKDECCAAGATHAACGTASDAGATDATPFDGGGGDAGGVCGGRFVITDPGTTPPAGSYVTDGSGEVLDTKTGLRWSRNIIDGWFPSGPSSSGFANAQSKCAAIGKRVPSLAEFEAIFTWDPGKRGLCDAFGYPNGLLWTTDKYNADTWWCVMRDGTKDYCINRPHIACVSGSSP